MKKFVMVLAMMMVLVAAVVPLVTAGENVPAPIINAKFLGVACTGKMSVLDSRVTVQIFLGGDQVFMLYEWGPGFTGVSRKPFSGGNQIWRMNRQKDGSLEYQSGTQKYTFRFREDGNIDALMAADNLYGALLKCEAVGILYGRVSFKLPSDLAVVPPAPDVPMPAISGTWFGMWVYGWGIRPGLLVVENLSKDIAQVVYAVSGSDPKWWRRNATVNGNILSWKFPNWPNTKEGAILKFTLLDDRLEGEFIQDGKTTGTVTMTK